MSARIDYQAGGEAGYTGDTAALPAGLDRYARSLFDTFAGGVNRLVDVEIERRISARTPRTPNVPTPSGPTVAGFQLPEWAPLAAFALVGGYLLLRGARG